MSIEEEISEVIQQSWIKSQSGAIVGNTVEPLATLFRTKLEELGEKTKEYLWSSEHYSTTDACKFIDNAINYMTGKEEYD